MLAARDNLAFYHLESVKLFSSNEEPQFLNPEKNVKDPPCALSPAMWKCIVVRTLESSLSPRGVRWPCSHWFLSSPPIPQAASPPLPSSCLRPSHLISFSLGSYYVSGAQYRDTLLSNVQSWPRDKNAAQVALFPKSAAWRQGHLVSGMDSARLKSPHTRELTAKCQVLVRTGNHHAACQDWKGLVKGAFQTGSDSYGGLDRLTSCYSVVCELKGGKVGIGGPAFYAWVFTQPTMEAINSQSVSGSGELSEASSRR